MVAITHTVQRTMKFVQVARVNAYTHTLEFEIPVTSELRHEYTIGSPTIGFRRLRTTSPYSPIYETSVVDRLVITNRTVGNQTILKFVFTFTGDLNELKIMQTIYQLVFNINIDRYTINFNGGNFLERFGANGFRSQNFLQMINSTSISANVNRRTLSTSRVQLNTVFNSEGITLFLMGGGGFAAEDTDDALIVLNTGQRSYDIAKAFNASGNTDVRLSFAPNVPLWTMTRQARVTTDILPVPIVEPETPISADARITGIDSEGTNTLRVSYQLGFTPEVGATYTIRVNYKELGRTSGTQASSTNDLTSTRRLIRVDPTKTYEISIEVRKNNNRIFKSSELIFKWGQNDARVDEHVQLVNLTQKVSVYTVRLTETEMYINIAGSILNSGKIDILYVVAEASGSKETTPVPLRYDKQFYSLKLENLMANTKYMMQVQAYIEGDLVIIAEWEQYTARAAAADENHNAMNKRAAECIALTAFTADEYTEFLAQSDEIKEAIVAQIKVEAIKPETGYLPPDKNTRNKKPSPLKDEAGDITDNATEELLESILGTDLSAIPDIDVGYQ